MFPIQCGLSSVESSSLFEMSAFFPTFKSTPSPPLLSSRNPKPNLPNYRSVRLTVTDSSSDEDPIPRTPTRLVTFLGKGGSGKTTASVLAAQHYALTGLSTCLVIHSQDPTAEYLLNSKIGTAPVTLSQNLTALKLETTKLLLEPLSLLKKADASLNLTQGALPEVLGEELGVLPGMDSLFSAYILQSLVAQRNDCKDKFAVIVYDGVCNEETLRIVGATGRARLYMKYLQILAEKTDIGRLVGPSITRLMGETLHLNGKTSAEIWDSLDQTLERASSRFAEPGTFGCYLIMDPNNPLSVNSALHYWGCAIQAGAQVSGAFGIAPPKHYPDERGERVKDDFSPLPFALIPHLSIDSSLDWRSIVVNVVSGDVRDLLSETARMSSIRSIVIDRTKKTVTLFMPGFDKSEIKLYQYRGGSELLVEARDQRRVIELPHDLQGKVGAAKFIDRRLVITIL